ncbi:MAG: hypothetical protein Q4B03_07705 [Lachnospiraceae bacterium]|nr:hypothetical protein [Lachnospiraceae bacterium]
MNNEKLQTVKLNDEDLDRLNGGTRPLNPRIHDNLFEDQTESEDSANENNSLKLF